MVVGVAAIALGAAMVFTGGTGSSSEPVEKVQTAAETTQTAESEQSADTTQETETTDEGQEADASTEAGNVGETIPMDLGTYIFENAADRNYIMGISSGFGDNGAGLVLKSYEDSNKNRIFVTDEVEDDGERAVRHEAGVDCVVELEHRAE